MNNQYRCKHFIIQELVPPQVYEARGYKAWELIDVRLLMTLDRLRNRFGSMKINDWKWGGNREWSGLRTPNSPYYSPYSQHTFGRAADILFADITAEEVRQEILADPDNSSFDLIYSMELATSWLHIDVRNATRIKTFKP